MYVSDKHAKKPIVEPPKRLQTLTLRNAVLRALTEIAPCSLGFLLRPAGHYAGESAFIENRILFELRATGTFLRSVGSWLLLCALVYNFIRPQTRSIGLNSGWHFGSIRQVCPLFSQAFWSKLGCSLMKLCSMNNFSRLSSTLFFSTLRLALALRPSSRSSCFNPLGKRT